LIVVSFLIRHIPHLTRGLTSSVRRRGIPGAPLSKCSLHNAFSKGCFRRVDNAGQFAGPRQMQGFTTAGGLCARQGSETQQMPRTVELNGVGHLVGYALNYLSSSTTV